MVTIANMVVEDNSTRVFSLVKVVVVNSILLVAVTAMEVVVMDISLVVVVSCI
jgi:hypothetical protein